MARLPNAVSPDVQPAGAPANDYQEIRATPASFGGAVGAAEQKVGAQGVQAADQGLGVATAFQDRWNEVATDDAFNKFQSGADNLTYGTGSGDPNDPASKGLYALRGADALTAGPQVVKKLSDLRDQIKGGLQNDAQRLQFDQASRRLLEYKSAEISRHLDAQGDAYALAVNKSTVDNAARSAGLAYNSDEAIMHSIQDGRTGAVKAAQVQFGTNASPEILQGATSKSDNLVVRSAIEGALASDPNGGPALASGILKKYGNMLDPQTRAELSQRLAHQGDRAAVAAAINDGTGGYTGTAAPIEPAARDRANLVRDGLIKRGLDPDTATAFAANSLHESAADPNTGPGDDGASHGLFMWRGDRSSRFQDINGHAVDNAPLDEQLDYVMYELQGPESDAAKQISQAQGPAAKAAAVSQAYLRPKDVGPEMQRRAATAQQLATGASQTTSSTGANPTGTAPNLQAQPVSTGAVPGAAPGATPGATSAQHNPQPYGDEFAQMQHIRQLAQQRFPDRPDLQREVIEGGWLQIQQANTLQAKYEAEQAKAKKDAQEAAGDAVVTHLIKDPTSFDPKTIADNPALTYEQKWNLYKIAQSTLAQGPGNKDQQAYGSGFYTAFQMVHAAPGAAGRITDPQQLYSHVGPNGDITVAGLDKLTSEIKGLRTPDGAADGKMRDAALAYAKHALSFERDLGVIKIRDPKGEDAFNVGFMPAFFKAYDAGVEAGKTPYQLLSKDSPDFIVDKIVSGYKRTPAQIAKDMLEENNDAGAAPVAAPQPGAAAPDANTQAGILTLYNSGKMTREQASQALIAKGFARAPAPMAAAPARPTVPTNE